MTDLQKEQCRQIYDTYGMMPQLDMLVEECSELIRAVCKYKRNLLNGKSITAELTNTRKICDEMADVLIMIQQIKGGLDIDDGMLNGSIEYKLRRQMQRIENGGK